MSQVIDHPQVATPGLSRFQAGALVAAPVPAIVARVLITPWYQDDANKPDNSRVLTEVADSVGRNQVGAMLAVLSAALFVLAAIVVGGLVRARSPRVGLTGLVLAGSGAFGLALFAAFVGVITIMAGHDDREAMLELMTRLNESAVAGVSFVVLVLGAVGWLVLGYGLYRAAAIPRAAAVFSALGGAGVMLTTTGPAISFIAGSAVLCLFGFAWVALAAQRRS
jgi:hypothetical protein